MRPALFAGLSLSLLGLVPGDDFPKPYDSETDKAARPMPAAEAASKFRLPEGFRVEVFASEPEVRQPIAMAWDPRGRLWVAENYTYAERSKKFDLTLRDRVLIFQDADGDGKPETRTVFTDDVQSLTSVEVGRGGVWLMCPPQLLYIPDRNGDDRPDGPAQVVLDGFDVPAENYHNVANGLKWGPDGWLYGRCGASAPGEIGAPGTPKERRIPLRGGLWRYHPERKTFEALAHGTTNPWGHDWNALGEAFFINTVNGHLWHAVPGMHFVRPHTIDPNPHVYDLIDQHADHFHWDTAKDWSDSRTASGEHDRRGGGHAHSGMMIYGGTQWPESMRGRLFTLNFHGRRINEDRLERSGSGYVGKHEPDPMFAADPFFRGIDLSEGPDGSVYVLDWNDTGECHENTGVVRSSGRIYRIVYGPNSKAMAPIDLAKARIGDLVRMAIEGDEWHARRARQVVAERATAPDVSDVLRAGVPWEQVLRKGPTTAARLRALWALHGCGLVSDATLIGLLKDEDEAVRAWAIRLLTDALPLDTALGKRPPIGDPGVNPAILPTLVVMAASSHETPSVRLALASTLQRLPAGQRWELAAALGRHAADADDHNLPLLLWYGIAPIADSEPERLAYLGRVSGNSITRRLIARRLAESLEESPEGLTSLLNDLPFWSDAKALDLLIGIREGTRGWRKATPPATWARAARSFAAAEDPRVRDLAREIGILFGDGRALEEVKALALDPKADLESRRSALKSLIDARPDDLRATCEKLLSVRFLNTTAVRGLALFDDPEIGKSLAKNYRVFHPSERPAVLETLASRRAFAGALLDGVTNGSIPKADVTAFHARQVRSLNDEALTKRLADVWGEVRDSPAAKAGEIAAWKGKLTASALGSADRSKGRAVFNKVCASCHNLYGQGGAIGPDLTGSGRDNLDYLLENMLDPGATVTADYRMVVVAMKDGRVLNGIVKAQNDKGVTLQTQTEPVTLARADIEETRPSTQSLMPEGLLSPLSEAEVRDLIAYLMHRAQVPLP